MYLTDIHTIAKFQSGIFMRTNDGFPNITYKFVAHSDFCRCKRFSSIKFRKCLQILFATYLEKLLEWRMQHRIGHKGQSVKWQEFCGLAQCCPPSLQVVFEVCNSVVKLSFILHKRMTFHISHAAWSNTYNLESTLATELNERLGMSSGISDFVRTSVG